MKNLFYILLVLICANSCNVVKKDSLSKTDSTPILNPNYVYLDDVKDGIGLDRAKIVSDKKYFDYIMSNELGNPDKKPVYETVQATSDKIYFGVVRNVYGTNKLVVDPFYACDNSKIVYYFPGFEDIDGTNVQAKIFYSFFDKEVETKLKPQCPNSYTFNYNDYDIELTNLGIMVESTFQGKCYEDTEIGMELTAILNPTNLDVIQYHYILKDKATGTQTEEGMISETKNVFTTGYKDKSQIQYKN